MLPGDGQRDGTGTGAQVDHGGRLDRGDPPQAPVDQQFGLRPGDEHTRPDREIEQPERGPASEVLDRTAGGPVAYQPGVAGQLRIVEAGAEQPAPWYPEDLGGEQLSVDPGRVHPGPGEQRGRHRYRILRRL